MSKFLTKYMQIFNDYNEFGENSDDYVRGEDHIAYLIDDFEVIYWLYLENVWRPLNVVFEGQGTLDDGRNYGRVYLREIQGDTVYINVPNIPDPERVYSMKDFLKEYPDIENLYVKDTTNLVTLESAFANSHIRTLNDFNTQSVTNFNSAFAELLSTDLNVELTTNESTIDIQDILNKSTVDTFILNMPNVTNFVNSTSYSYISIGDKITANSIILNYNDDYDDTNIYMIVRNNAINYLKAINIMFYADMTSNDNVYKYKIVDCKNLILSAHSTASHLFLNDESHTINAENISVNTDDLYYVNNGNLKLNCDTFEFYIFGAEQGSYIDVNDVKNINVKNGSGINSGINAFLFEVDKVDNELLNKYKCFFSIFQYKTYGDEIADIDIQPYDDYLINFPNIERNTSDTYDLLHNKEKFITDETKLNTVSCKIYVPFNMTPTNSNSDYNVSYHFKELIIDNSSYDLDEDTAPTIISTTSSSLLSADDGYISGAFKYANTSNYLYASFYPNYLFKDATIYKCYRAYITTTTCDFYSSERNIKFISFTEDNITYPTLYLSGNFSDFDVILLDVYSFINQDNIIANDIQIQYRLGTESIYVIFKYYDDVIFNIATSDSSYIYINFFRYYMIYPNKIYVTGNVYINGASFVLSNYVQPILENVYIYNCTLKNLFILAGGYVNSNNVNRYGTFIPIKNIYGDNITLTIETYNTNYDFWAQDDIYTHIDIASSILEDGAYLTIFENFDDETLINAVDKLVDNTEDSIKTLYIYRSQFNIIGEEVIANAVNKNYEIAVIEN